jgi:hypothetical protein
MESCSNQKSVKQIKIYFIFEILQSSYPLPWWQFTDLRKWLLFWNYWIGCLQLMAGLYQELHVEGRNIMNRAHTISCTIPFYLRVLFDLHNTFISEHFVNVHSPEYPLPQLYNQIKPMNFVHKSINKLWCSTTDSSNKPLKSLKAAINCMIPENTAE